MKPIGYFLAPGKTQKLQAGRQGSEDLSVGIIELTAGHNFEQALEGLAGFSHLWVIYEFHLNKTWKPKVQPPRLSQKKIGVFATRSPYRPNPIGLSQVKIKAIKGRKIWVEGVDLLDQTPILDLKPYIPYSDSVPKAKTGWFKKPKPLKITKSAEFIKKIKWLQLQGIEDLFPIIQQQLTIDPFSNSSKRIEKNNRTNSIFSIRKWRIHFQATKTELKLKDISSNYQSEETQHPEDPIHQKFLAAKGSGPPQS